MVVWSTMRRNFYRKRTVTVVISKSTIEMSSLSVRLTNPKLRKNDCFYSSIQDSMISSTRYWIDFSSMPNLKAVMKTYFVVNFWIAVNMRWIQNYLVLLICREKSSEESSFVAVLYCIGTVYAYEFFVRVTLCLSFVL